MLDELLDALGDLDIEELQEADRTEDLDLTELCDVTTPAGIVFRFLCILCDRTRLLEKHPG